MITNISIIRYKNSRKSAANITRFFLHSAGSLCSLTASVNVKFKFQTTKTAEISIFEYLILSDCNRLYMLCSDICSIKTHTLYFRPVKVKQNFHSPVSVREPFLNWLLKTLFCRKNTIFLKHSVQEVSQELKLLTHTKRYPYRCERVRQVEDIYRV